MKSSIEKNIWDGKIYVYNGGKVYRNHKEQITTVRVADGVTTIHRQAFERCHSLTTVILPSSSIPRKEEYSLEEEEKENSSQKVSTLTDIDDRAFYECYALGTITIGVDKGKKSNNNVLPPSLQRIGKRAFFKCYNMNNIDFASAISLEVIEKEAFHECSGLTHIKFPESIKRIGPFAFFQCFSLKSIAFSQQQVNQNSGTERNDDDGGKFNDDNSSNNDKPTKKKRSIILGGEAFAFCNELARVQLADSKIERLSQEIFYGCRKLYDIDFGNSIKYIDSSVFGACSSLTTLKIPPSVKCIGDKAFAWCYDLKDVEFLGPVERIGRGAFMLCSDLMSIALPPSITKIERETFRDCSSLRRVILPERFESIGKGAFHDCSQLTVVDLPAVENKQQQNQHQSFQMDQREEQRLEGYFWDCTEEGSGRVVVHIPNSVRNIGRAAFLGCDKLSTVINDRSIHAICDLNDGGRNFLPIAHQHPIALWPLILHRALFGMKLVTHHMVSIPTDINLYKCPNEQMRRRCSIVYYLLVQSAGEWYNNGGQEEKRARNTKIDEQQQNVM